MITDASVGEGDKGKLIGGLMRFEFLRSVFIFSGGGQARIGVGFRRGFFDPGFGSNWVFLLSSFYFRKLMK